MLCSPLWPRCEARCATKGSPARGRVGCAPSQSGLFDLRHGHDRRSVDPRRNARSAPSPAATSGSGRRAYKKHDKTSLGGYVSFQEVRWKEPKGNWTRRKCSSALFFAHMEQPVCVPNHLLFGTPFFAHASAATCGNVGPPDADVSHVSTGHGRRFGGRGTVGAKSLTDSASSIRLEAVI